MQDECASTEQPLTDEPTLLISELGEVSPRLHKPDSAGGKPQQQDQTVVNVYPQCKRLMTPCVWDNGPMTDSGREPGRMADQVVGMLHQVDDKVNDMRNSIESDPESLADKLVKFALPSIAALLAGKLFQAFWGGLVRKRNGGVDSPEEDQESATAGLLFGVLSAAVTALVSGLFERGSQALIDRRHQR